jgi:hypothetical protein
MQILHGIGFDAPRQKCRIPVRRGVSTKILDNMTAGIDRYPGNIKVFVEDESATVAPLMTTLL